MAFDGIVCKGVIEELNKNIIGGKICRILEPNKNEIILEIYSKQYGNLFLDLCIDSNNCRINLSNHKKTNPATPPNFCMLLRKHLVGFKIKSFSGIDLERIVFIELEGLNELNDIVNKTLIVELMGKHSNIILVNSNSIIIDSLRHIDSLSDKSYRNILPAREYILPITDKKSFLEVSSFDEFSFIIDSNIANIATSFTGISKIFIEYCLDKFSNNLKEIYEFLKLIVISKNIKCIYFKDKKNYVPEISDDKNELSINHFLDEFYYSKENNEAFVGYRNALLKLILDMLKKYSNRLNVISKKLDDCSKMDTFRIYGELLTANLYRLFDTHSNFITVENYYDNNNIIKIPLDKKLSLSNNAKRYFKKYSKLKNALEIVSVQKKETEKELEYLESVVFSLESASSLLDIQDIYLEISENPLFSDKLTLKKQNSKKKISKDIQNNSPLKFTINDNYIVLVGKNNKQNDFLTLKLAMPNDIWFHTKDIPGSHVILKNNNHNLEITDEILLKCAQITAYFSKAKNSSNVAVDYTFVKNVKKPSGANPGKVIYIKFNTLYVNPMQP